MSSPLVVATIALQGATVGVASELAVRSIFRKRDKAVSVRIGKFFLGLCMAIKTILFLSFHSSLWTGCHATGRIADLFYHLAMTAGTHVLVTRVQSIVPIEWRRRALYFHWSITTLRLLIGCVDVALITVTFYPNDGTCEYIDEEYWGSVYTLYDTVIDLYVTMMISAILINHIRSLVADRMKVNKSLYTSVIYHNVIRTVLLTIVNLISAIFIIMKGQVEVIMLLWPIINVFFVVLVGYDSDVTKSIRSLSQRCWRSMSNVTSTIDLGVVPSFTSPIPRILNTPISFNLDKQPSVETEAHPEDINESEDYDLSLIHIQQWKSRLSSTEQEIQNLAGYDRDENRLSLSE